MRTRNDYLICCFWTPPQPLALGLSPVGGSCTSSENQQPMDILKKLVRQGKLDDRDLAMVVEEEELLKLLLEKRMQNACSWKIKEAFKKSFLGGAMSCSNA